MSFAEKQQVKMSFGEVLLVVFIVTFYFCTSRTFQSIRAFSRKEVESTCTKVVFIQISVLLFELKLCILSICVCVCVCIVCGCVVMYTSMLLPRGYFKIR